MTWVRASVASVVMATATSAASAAVIEAGRPVRVRVVDRTAIVEGRAIRATLVEPIYVRDRIVVAAGAVVSGRMARAGAASTRVRLAAMSGGDLTPPAGVGVRFDLLAPIDDAPVRIAATS